jgi:hypothetical protein
MPTFSFRRIRAACGAGAVLVLASTAALATPDEVAQHEIDHLLDFVATSNCTFVRNGEAHPGTDARAHLETKYNFTKWRLSSADEFVKYLATESSTSHEPYKVICNNKEQPAGVWLAEELKRYRKVAQSTPAR